MVFVAAPLVAALIVLSGGVGAAAPLRVTVRVAGPDDQAVRARLEASVSDLPVALTVAATAPVEPALVDQLAAVDRFAGPADAAIWFERWSCQDERGQPVSALVVHLVELPSKRLLVRLLGATACDGRREGEAPLSSALLESAALVLRAALAALAEGGHIDASPPLGRGGSHEAPVPPRRQVRLAAGGLYAFDGVTAGQPGLGARVGLAGARLGVELVATATLPTSVSDPSARLWLSRVGGAAGPVVRWPWAASWAVSAAVHVGGALAFRTTVPRAAAVVATPASRNGSVSADGELRLAWAPRALGGLALVLTVAADWLPQLPRIGYQRGPQIEDERSSWFLQPRVGLAFELGH